MAEVDDSRDFFGPNDAIITYEAGARYALLLRNNTKTHLYPYVLVFDPTLYEVEIFYKPSERYAPLRAGKALQLGGSSECENAILFTLPEGQTADISYFKASFYFPVRMHVLIYATSDYIHRRAALSRIHGAAGRDGLQWR